MRTETAPFTQSTILNSVIDQRTEREWKGRDCAPDGTFGTCPIRHLNSFTLPSTNRLYRETTPTNWQTA